MAYNLNFCKLPGMPILLVWEPYFECILLLYSSGFCHAIEIWFVCIVYFVSNYAFAIFVPPCFLLRKTSLKGYHQSWDMKTPQNSSVSLDAFYFYLGRFTEPKGAFVCRVILRHFLELPWSSYPWYRRLSGNKAPWPTLTLKIFLWLLISWSNSWKDNRVYGFQEDCKWRKQGIMW